MWAKANGDINRTRGLALEKDRVDVFETHLGGTADEEYEEIRRGRCLLVYLDRGQRLSL